VNATIDLSGMGSVSAANRWLLRHQFGLGARRQFYNSLAVLLNNHVLLVTALQTVYDVASDGDRKRTQVQAVVAADLIAKVSNGSTFAAALAEWVHPAEASIIAAGEAAGRLSASFQDAIDLLGKRTRIWKAVVVAGVYPGVLFGMMIVILIVVSVFVVPKLAGISDPETWERAAAVLYSLSQFVVSSGAYVAILCVAALAWVLWSFANLIGSLRITLDRFPPWSIYRLIQGSGVLLNMAAMLRAGVRLTDALEITIEHATPWLRERLSSARTGIAMGLNFGEALAASGHGFPAPDAIKFLRTLSGLDGFEKGLTDYAELMLEETTARAEQLAKVVTVGAMGFVVMFVLMVVTAISDIQSAIEAGLT